MMMKKLIYLFGLSMVLLMSSCSQDDEMTYCCNEEINNFIVENLGEIQKMTRGEWLNSAEEMKAPIFGAFSSEQKIEFWREKLTETLLLDWNDLEAEHIRKLLEFVENPDNFIYFNVHESKSEEEIEYFEIFMYKWTEYAYDVLNWNKQQIGAIIASGNRLIDTKGRLLVNNVKRVKSVSENKCNCNITVIGDFCSGSATCEDTDCEEVPYCGIFLLQMCNGECRL